MVQKRTVDQLWIKACPGLKVEVPLDYLELYCTEIAGGLASAISERLGEEGLQLVEKVMYGVGKRLAERYKLMGKVKGTDIKSVGEFYAETLFDGWLGTAIVAESTEEKVVHRIAACEYGCDKRALCHAMMGLDRGIVEAINPRATVYTLKTVAAGDPYCENVVRKRNTSNK